MIKKLLLKNHQISPRSGRHHHTPLLHSQSSLQVTIVTGPWKLRRPDTWLYAQLYLGMLATVPNTLVSDQVVDGASGHSSRIFTAIQTTFSLTFRTLSDNFFQLSGPKTPNLKPQYFHHYFGLDRTARLSRPPPGVNKQLAGDTTLHRLITIQGHWLYITTRQGKNHPLFLHISNYQTYITYKMTVCRVL